MGILPSDKNSYCFMHVVIWPDDINSNRVNEQRKYRDTGFANISHNKNALLGKTCLQPIPFLLQYWPSRSFKVN